MILHISYFYYNRFCIIYIKVDFKIFKKHNQVKSANQSDAHTVYQGTFSCSHKNDQNSQKILSTKWASLYKKEDWWAVWIGLIIFTLSLPSLTGAYIFGWVPVAKTWLDITQSLSAKLFNPWIGLIVSFIFLFFLLLPVNRFNGNKSKDWLKGFSIIFFTCWGIWILSNYSPVVKIIGSSEVGFIIALIAGIVVTNTLQIPS